MPKDISRKKRELEELTATLYQRTEELYQTPSAEPDKNGLVTLPFITLSDIIVFPRMVSPVFIYPGQNLDSVQEAQNLFSTLVILFSKDSEADLPTKRSYLPIGIEASIGRLINLPDGNYSALVQGRRRVEILHPPDPLLGKELTVKPITEVVQIDHKVEALMRATRDMFERCVNLDQSLPEDAHLFSMNVADPGWLADLVATAISLDIKDRQSLLMTIDPIERLKRLNWYLAQELDVLQLETDIQSQVQREVDRNQREFYLREQLKAIQGELGENDIFVRDIGELKEKIQKAQLPEEVEKQAYKELERLEQMTPMSPEVSIIRNYLDWILDLPWNDATDDNLKVPHAARILEKHHYGLGKAKDRILEFIAVSSLKPKNSKQPILCFVGPPGTGKTSLGKSIAEALGKKFVRLSLGGVRDEAEIRGHRRTYIGALPGRILQTMRRAGTINPLFMLDEVDKLGSDFRGDPSSALLEVLDPEQNFAFSDHFLELPYDLSKVMFITTANSLSSIPSALLDRMEVIEFPGYVEEDKLEIAKRFLIPRQKTENGLETDDILLSDEIILKLIREYTYEAGVRNLEREIGKLCRKIARQKSERKKYSQLIDVRKVERFLGPPQYFQTFASNKEEVGLALGVAWTENGGEIMPVEVLVMDGKGNLQITGQIGDIMQESAQAALSYIKSISRDLGIDPGCYERIDIHVHIPEGAIPKDGPSAGITMCVAMVSALVGKSTAMNIAMTGEITLRGKVLPVGGVREKVLAAHRAGIRVIVLPEKNQKDLVDIPEKSKKDIHFIFTEHMDYVLKLTIRDVLIKESNNVLTKLGNKPKVNKK